MLLPLRLACLLLLVCNFAAGATERYSIAYPGPGNLSYLPLDLAPRIGADKAEGVELMALHTGGGGSALQQLQNRNVDFAVAGVPAAMAARAKGSDVVVIAPVNDLAVFVFMVRSELRGQVKRPRDLAGRVVGVNTSSTVSKTTSQQLAELILRNDGVAADKVRFAAAGQSWDEQSSAVRAASVDAVLGDEPFASRLRESGEVFFLFNLGHAADAAKIPGAGFLHAALETRSDVIREAPAKVAKMVAVLRRTLAWLAQRTPEEIAEALALRDGEEKRALIKALRQHPRAFSSDGVFSERQIVETDRFFAATEGGLKPVALQTLLDARWAGRKP